MAMTLKAARVNAGLTQKEAAKMLGISANSLCAYERGRFYPTINIVKRMEKVYNVNYNDLIFFNVDPI